MAKYIGCVCEDDSNRVDVAELFSATHVHRVGVTIAEETVVLTSEQAIDLARLLVKAAVGETKQSVCVICRR
jgi:hypothetical protein